MTRVVKLMDKLETMSGEDISQLSFQVISKGNVIYLAASFFVAILFVLFMFVSTYIFFSDHDEESQKYSLSGFLKSLPALLGFVLILLIPVNFIAQFPIFLMLALFIISAVYLSPAIIIIEKKSALVSIMKSMKKTYGFKLSIFMNLLTLYSLQQIFTWLISFLINVDSVGFYLVDGFLFAFLIVAIGKNIGAFYKIAKELPEAI